MAERVQLSISLKTRRQTIVTILTATLDEGGA
jgi:hypothetical protein